MLDVLILTYINCIRYQEMDKFVGEKDEWCVIFIEKLGEVQCELVCLFFLFFFTNDPCL